MADFRSIPKLPSLPEVVFKEVQRLIAEGELRPGDRLPSETEMAERFGIGRSSIREAMRALQLLGVIEVIQGKGTFVREAGILPLVVDWTRIAEIGVISEVMEARQFLEVLLAQLAAERATDEDIDALRNALQHSRETISDLETNIRAGVDFHLALADAAHNQVLALMYRTIHDLYLETARRTRITSQIARERLHDHELIFQAVTDRDPEAVAQAMREHLEKARQILTAGGQDG
ncbi:MAG: FadR/GntR family transcriptional regulator [Anaerolineae bacterium]